MPERHATQTGHYRAELEHELGSGEWVLTVWWVDTNGNRVSVRSSTTRFAGDIPEHQQRADLIQQVRRAAGLPAEHEGLPEQPSH